jgi:hypothetical protein
MIANVATLQFHTSDGQERVVGELGDDGEFAWLLRPGTYEVTGVRFYNRGDRVDRATNFTFEVPADREAIYVGTVTLETTFNSRYHGVSGNVDRYTVANDCDTDCASRLEKLGLEAESAAVVLMQDSNTLALRK